MDRAERRSNKQKFRNKTRRIIKAKGYHTGTDESIEKNVRWLEKNRHNCSCWMCSQQDDNKTKKRKIDCNEQINEYHEDVKKIDINEFNKDRGFDICFEDNDDFKFDEEKVREAYEKCKENIKNGDIMMFKTAEEAIKYLNGEDTDYLNYTGHNVVD